MKWQITFYSQKVFKEINGFEKDFVAKFFATIKRMADDGPDLGMPHTKAMGKGLFEIRVQGKDGIMRAFYCVAHLKEIVILHAFIKKTQKTPDHDLGIAIKRMKEVKENA